jgi:ATP-dependent protease HslVU (ClpYQ) peptidase subunit
MTTIAAIGDEIAWDSQVTAGYTRSMVPFDKVRVFGRTIIATCGDFSAADKLPNWVLRGARKKSAPAGEWTCLVITEKAIRIYENDRLDGTLVTLPVAIGTGEEFALGAMGFGATARQAVEVAAKFDVMTGGEIKSLKISDVFSRKRKTE